MGALERSESPRPELTPSEQALLFPVSGLTGPTGNERNRAGRQLTDGLAAHDTRRQAASPDPVSRIQSAPPHNDEIK